MKVYQPTRKDLLINTDWGIPKDKLSKEDTKNQNLVLFKNRWVTEKERKILKKQFDTYSTIRAFCWLLIIGAVIMAALAFFSTQEFLARVELLIGVVINVFIAIDLFRFKQWARWTFTVIASLNGVIITGIIIHAEKSLFGVALIFGFGVVPLTIVLYHLHNNTARQIFKGASV